MKLKDLEETKETEGAEVTKKKFGFKFKKPSKKMALILCNLVLISN